MAEKKGILAWLQDNLRLIASAFIVLFLAFLVYSYASKNNRMEHVTLDTEESSATELVDAPEEAADAVADTATDAVTGAGATLDALAESVDDVEPDQIEEKKARKSFRELIGLGGSRDNTTEEDREEASAEETPADMVTQKAGTITVKAAAGDGLTHLARKATASYMADHGDLNLTDEHKVYVEDYLRKAVGGQNLAPGDDVSFGGDLIAQAVAQAQDLSPQQLANLTKYAYAVSGL